MYCRCGYAYGASYTCKCKKERKLTTLGPKGQRETDNNSSFITSPVPDESDSEASK